MKHSIIAQADHYYGNMHKAVQISDARTIEAREEQKNQGAELMRWLMQMLKTENPWQLLDDHLKKLTNGDLCDEALLVLLDHTLVTVKKKPDLLSELRHMATVITSAAKVAIDSYQEIARGNQKARTKDRKKLPKELRPAEIYRRFAKPLRWMRDQGDVKAALVLREVMAEQTMPFEELDSPSWIEAYTRSVDPNADRPGDIKVRVTVPELNTEIAKKMASDLGWDEGVVRDFLNAQEGFNSEDNLEFIMDAVNEDALGRLDDRQPQWMEMQGDCHTTPEINMLRGEAKPYLKNCRKLIDGLVKKANEQADMADRYWKTAFFKTIKEGFRDSVEAKDYIAFLNEKAEEGSAAADLAALFLVLQHGYGFEEADAAQVRLHTAPNFRTLSEWLDFWGDEFLESMNDGAWRWKELTTEEIGAIADQTIEDILDVNDHPTSDIFRTRAFMEGYLKCMMNANIITKVDNGHRHNLAVEAGWETWRQWKNPIGAAAYHRAKNDGAEQKDAMAAFWKEVRAEEKRIATGTVVSPKVNGILLNTGRIIDWRIALIKLQANELHFPGDTRARIKKALTERGMGLDFAKAL